MPLSIKTVRKILDDVISQDIGLTEDSDVLFVVGEPSNGGVIYLAVDTNVATRTVDGEEQSAFFFNIDTVQNIINQQLGVIDMINPHYKEAVKEDS